MLFLIHYLQEYYFIASIPCLKYLRSREVWKSLSALFLASLTLLPTPLISSVCFLLRTTAIFPSPCGGSAGCHCVGRRPRSRNWRELAVCPPFAAGRLDTRFAWNACPACPFQRLSGLSSQSSKFIGSRPLSYLSPSAAFHTLMDLFVLCDVIQTVKTLNG